MFYSLLCVCVMGLLLNNFLIGEAGLDSPSGPKGKCCLLKRTRGSALIGTLLKPTYGLFLYYSLHFKQQCGHGDICGNPGRLERLMSTFSQCNGLKGGIFFVIRGAISVDSFF